MSAVSWRRNVLALLVVLAAAAVPAQADTVSINVDQARVMRLPDGAATVVIGNPLIADATLQSGGVVVLTGKSYGATNMLALDRNGRIIMDKTVQVLSASDADLVVVYRGSQRESYSCAPDCERRITLGDTPAFFELDASAGRRPPGAGPERRAEVSADAGVNGPLTGQPGSSRSAQEFQNFGLLRIASIRGARRRAVSANAKFAATKVRHPLDPSNA